MAITKEQARKDLEKIMSRFGTIGDGTAVDRAAQLVMQTMGVLERRLNKRSTIKMLYFDMQDSSELLASSVYEVAQNYVKESIDENTAREKLQDVQKQYQEVFKDMGITPQTSKALFGYYNA